MAEPTIEHLLLSDGYRAAVRWWRPANSRGAVLYFHGIQSHGGWYEMSGARLAEAGFTVLMPDRRGSGLNDEQRGHVDSADRCVADARDALDALLRETGDSAAHLVGVSWGGRPAVALAATCPDRVRTLSLIAPGLFPRIDLSRGEKFRVAVAMLNDRARMFDIPLNDPRLFTASPERIQFVANDTLKLLRVSSSFLLATRRMDKYVRGLGRSSWRGGVHLLLAGRDQIIDNERSRVWLRDLPSADRQISDFPDAEHTLEFEADAEPFLASLVEWIAERAGSGAINSSMAGQDQDR